MGAHAGNDGAPEGKETERPMSLNQTVDAMREVPMFRNVDPKQLRLFAFMGETLNFRAGERLFQKGDEGDAAYIIIEGEVEVIVPTPNGEISVAVLGEKELFGEMAVIRDTARSTAIGAKSDLKVLRLDRSTMFKLLTEFPNVALEMIKTMADHLEAMNDQVAQLKDDLARLRNG